jgi:hypothetical protein
MAMRSIRCPVLKAHVTRVEDFEGEVIGIICPEYEESSGTCRLMTAAFDSGPLGQLVERVADETLSTRSRLCIMRAR